MGRESRASVVQAGRRRAMRRRASFPGDAGVCFLMGGGYVGANGPQIVHVHPCIPPMHFSLNNNNIKIRGRRYSESCKRGVGARGF